MLKIMSVWVLVLFLASCTTYRQPRVTCSGHLERINASFPDATAQKGDVQGGGAKKP